MKGIPPEPSVPEEQRSSSEVELRYEDISQDGRLTLAGMPHALGPVFWRRAAAEAAVGESLRAAGVVPILSRLCTEGGSGSLSVRHPLMGAGRFRMAHTRDAAGEVERLLLEVWVDLRGPRARVHGPPPSGVGEVIHAGRVYAEHVFTRPFAAKHERRVLALPGIEPAVPSEQREWLPPERLMSLPEGATALEPCPDFDDVTLVFGLDHCDSNQHVNALVYPRLFLEAALRRFGKLDRGCGLARYQESAFRKPCFAGDRMRIALRCFERDGHIGAAGCFVTGDQHLPEGESFRPHVACMAWFEQ